MQASPILRVNVPRAAPSLARSLVSVPLDEFATQMLDPSKAIPMGELPTTKSPSTPPSFARILVTVLLPVFVTQILAPSNATPVGLPSTAKVAERFASYQWRMAI